MSLDTFTRAYIACALWSSNPGGDDGVSLDQQYGPDDIAPETLAEMREDCRQFYEDPNIQGALEYWTDEQAGHDFWLTRNGHGAGFWDRYYGDTLEAKAGKDLTAASKAWGSVDLYVGDDGMIHQ